MKRIIIILAALVATAGALADQGKLITAGPGQTPALPGGRQITMDVPQGKEARFYVQRRNPSGTTRLWLTDASTILHGEVVRAVVVDASTQAPALVAPAGALTQTTLANTQTGALVKKYTEATAGAQIRKDQPAPPKNRSGIIIRK